MLWRRSGLVTGFRLSRPGHLYVMSVESKQAADLSIGELMGQFSSQVSRLIRDEMKLAEKEFQESAKHAGIGAGLFSVAGLLAFFGAATVIAAAVAALSLALPVWAAALIVAAVLFIAAAVAALSGRSQAKEVTPAAPRTVETVKADIAEIKDARHGTP
jgi:Flp pilus assembly protein TadB